MNGLLPNNDQGLFFAFLLVFVRCSAALMTSPMFGAQNTPVRVRVLMSGALSAVLAANVQPKIGPIPDNLGGFVVVILYELAAGLLIGAFLGLAITMAQMAGSFLDFQVGLSMSQSLNPVTGVSVTVISQFKSLLAMIVFLSMNGHHLVIEAIIKSYTVSNRLADGSMQTILEGIMSLLAQGFIIAIQIAAPVLAVSMIVDAALGVMNKAIPQLQPIQIGMPIKIGLGLVALSFTVPALVTGVQTGVNHATLGLGRVFGFTG